MHSSAMLCLRHRGTADSAEKVFHGSVSIAFHNCLTFRALQNAMF